MKPVFALLAAVFLIGGGLLFYMRQSIAFEARDASDSDGTPSGNIVAKFNGLHDMEDVNLKTAPYGQITASGWALKRPAPLMGSVDVSLLARWDADAANGASDVYFGYSLDGKGWEEVGPLRASGVTDKTEIVVKGLRPEQLGSLEARWRASDADYRAPAFARVHISAVPKSVQPIDSMILLSLAGFVTCMLSVMWPKFKRTV